MLTIPKLLIQEPKKGNISGTCIFCGQQTKFGHRIKDSISGNFTMAYALQGGNCSCEYCYSFMKDQTYRRKSWVADNMGLKILDKNEKKNILFNPPDPPFFISITIAGQKQPWIQAFDRLSYSKNKYYFAYEPFGLVYFDRQIAIEMDLLIEKALRHKITKTELKTHFKMKTYERAAKEGFEELLEKIKPFRHNQLWEVLINVTTT